MPSKPGSSGHNGSQRRSTQSSAVEPGRSGNGTRTVAIACQGGGSLTAFTAGVLKHLLLDPAMDRYRVVGLSGTSGGALCALIAWEALLREDRPAGARKLQAFWDDNSANDPLDARLNAWIVFSGQFSSMVAVPEISPYDVPEMARQELAALIERHVSFESLRSLVRNDSPLLYIGAVNEASGAFKVFSGTQISIEKVLASAALPTIFRAVHIEDGPDRGVYWDGLFSQNPPVREFVQPAVSLEDKPDEIWVIRIDPLASRSEPRTITQIETRRNILAGNLSLNQELYYLQKVNAWLEKGWLPATRFKPIAVREIQLDVPMNPASKFDRTPSTIQHLIALGEEQGKRFLGSLN
ncbi:MAG: Patatin [Herminiimonas sp.]|nr:Patatin [Herminiimonas sp.]